MRFYSTRNKQHLVPFETAVLEGLAPDSGLYLPESLIPLDKEWLKKLAEHSPEEIGFRVAKSLIGDTLPDAILLQMVRNTLFEVAVKPVEGNRYSLELFHGPTLAFKDFGARFLSQVMGYIAQRSGREVTILVATSGDTGSAVANGFLNVPGTRVVVLYPSGKVSPLQEKQFTTLGGNITALEIEGTFDDCQALVKSAFADEELRNTFFITSANSINIARLIPQAFYYFLAWSQRPDVQRPVVYSVPSGNFGNLTAGLLAASIGLPVKAFIAATNINDIVPEFLRTGTFNPRPSLPTISNAMDVGNPSNVERLLDLAGGLPELRKLISGYAFTDEQTKAVMTKVYETTGYMLDPHGAIGYLGLEAWEKSNPESASADLLFLETAHPAKFREVVSDVLGTDPIIPERLAYFLNRTTTSIRMKRDYPEFRSWLFSALPATPTTN